jgi:hypothetical protein
MARRQPKLSIYELLEGYANVIKRNSPSAGNVPGVGRESKQHSHGRKAPKRRSAIAKDLRTPKYRRRVVPNKRRKDDLWKHTRISNWNLDGPWQ